MKKTITIIYDMEQPPETRFQMQAPFQDKLLCLGLLAIAQNVVMNFKEPSPIIKPGLATIPFGKGS